MVGSADGLRAVSDRITGDFILYSTDLLTDFNFGHLTALHRLRTSDVTMLLSTSPLEDVDKKGSAGKRMKIDEEDQEYIGTPLSPLSSPPPPLLSSSSPLS